jgi:hypothetical protein
MSTKDDVTHYVSAVKSAADLKKALPLARPLKTDDDWHWEDVALTDADRDLERWAWGLTRFGRPAVARAAAAMLEKTLPIWNKAAKARGPGIDTCLENIERGFDPSPQRLHGEIRAWLDAPTKAKVAAIRNATDGDRLDLFDAIGNEEFREVWKRDAWMFALTAAYAAAMTVYDDEDELPRAIGNVAVSCRLALAPTSKAKAAIDTWRAVTAAFVK